MTYTLCLNFLGSRKSFHSQFYTLVADEDKHSGAGSTGDLSQTTHSNHDPTQPTHSTMAAFPGQLLPGEDRTAPGALAGTGGIVGGVLLPPATNGQVLQGSTGTSLHSSDESLGTRNTDSSGRRSTTPAHSSTSDVHDLNGECNHKNIEGFYQWHSVRLWFREGSRSSAFSV